MTSEPTMELRWNGDVLEQKWTRPGRDWEGCACTCFEWRPIPRVVEKTDEETTR